MSQTYSDLTFTSFPDEIQTFVTMLNMAVSDASAVNGYQQAMRNGNYSLAQQYFNQINNGSSKIMDANKINTLMQTCIALQRFYESDIQPYLESKQSEWENTINTFSYLGDYSSSVNYNKNNFVTSSINGYPQLFLCISNAIAGTPITNTNYWRPLTLRGEQGSSGESLTFRYTWDATQTYYAQDIVVYNNIIWIAVSQNSNQTPSSSSSYWDLLYTASQDIYPFSTTTPTVTDVGSLWFEIIQ